MDLSHLLHWENIWIMIGFAGQFLFSMRFIYQWIYSERAKRSVIPEAFWYFSMFGGLTLLSYAIYRQDPVFIAGQAGGLLIYSRNIYFLWRDKKKATVPPTEDVPAQ